MKTLILFFVLITSTTLLSQNKIKEANNTFYQQEYTLAIEKYENLEKEYLPTIYNNYLAALIETKNYNKAEYIINKQISSFPGNPIYKIDKGHVYLSKGKKDKAYNIFNKIISDIQNYNRNIIIKIGNKFSNIEEYDFAIKSLKKGSKIYPEFELEIAKIYMKSGETENMINSYINAVKQNPNYKQHALNTFQNIFGRDGSEANKKYELLKKNLIKELQKSNNKEILDMIIWTYIQQYDFENAFKYAKIADRKYKEYQTKIFEIGNILTENKEYQIAVECFEYLSKTHENYELLSEIEIIKIMRKKCEIKNCEKSTLKKLDNKYRDIIIKHGVTYETKPLLKNYAKFLAFNYENTDTAIFILKELIRISTSPKFQAECNLDLADILLKNNKPWEAAKIYSDVEKKFKNETLGHMAKFQKAKIYFYTGNIEWAKAQLDILKVSTSKLIANDAMRKSLLITDNSNLDTSYDAIIMYAKAEYNFIQKKYNNTILILDSILNIFINHSIKDEIHLLKSNIYVNKQDYKSAIKELKKIIDDHYYDILGDEALFKYANILHEIYGDKKEAMNVYNKIITDFPNSIYSQKSRIKYRILRGDENL